MCLYEKVLLQGSIKLVTDLYTGDGESYHLSEAESLTGVLQCLPRAVNNRLYIRGSSIRGKLLSMATLLDVPLSIQTALFGSGTEGQISAGAIAVEDALACADQESLYRNGVSINDQLGTAQEHMLYRFECIPAGTEIPLTIRGDRISERHLIELMKLLLSIDGSLHSAMGAYVGKGYGRLRFEPRACRFLTANALCQWLDSDQSLEAYLGEHGQRSDWPDRPKTLGHVLGLTLRSESALVVNEPDPNRVERSADAAIRMARTGNPGQVQALIPGTSLVGICRARARRILMTIAQRCDKATIKDVDDYVDNMFGSELLSSTLNFSHATSTEPLMVHHRTQIAIDRLTGKASGSSDKKNDSDDPEKASGDGGALVMIEAALNAQYDAEVGINTLRQLPSVPGWKALLAFILRDAMDGDLYVGSGQARGFGQVWVEVQFDDNVFTQWDALQDHIQTHTALDLSAEALALNTFFKDSTTSLETPP